MTKDIVALLVAVMLLGGAVACEIEDDSSPPPRTPDPTAPKDTETPATPARTSTPVPAAVSTPTAVPAVTKITYVVQAGDVCWRIAQQFGISTAALLEANPRIDADCRNLRVGWELEVPVPGAAAPTSASQDAAEARSGESAPERTREPSQQPPSAIREQIEDCLDPWDGNHNGFEDQIRPLLNDEDSMETHETRFGLEEYAPNEVVVVMVYSAENAYGGRVKATASGLLNYKTCSVTVVFTGLE